MKPFLQFMILTIVVTNLTGCSRFREMTRRDYALLKDPFTSRGEESRTAMAGEAPVPGMSLSQAGFARVEAPAPGGLSNEATANYENVAKAGPTEPAGVSSTNFPGVKVSGVSDAVAANETPSVGAPNPFAPKPFDVATKAAANNNSEPQTPDMASLAKFMEDQARASGLTNTANELNADLSEFAAKRKQQWEAEVTGAEEKAAPLIQTVKQVSQVVEQVSGQTGQTARAVTNSVFNETANATASAADQARPLLDGQFPNAQARSQSRNATTTQPPIGSANPFAAIEAAMANTKKTPPTPPTPVFDSSASFGAVASPKASNSAPDPNDPFAAFGQQPVAQPASSSSAGKPASGGDTLDAGFNFDSGWRPSGVSRP